jgi:hypothetical protein
MFLFQFFQKSTAIVLEQVLFILYLVTIATDTNKQYNIDLY